MATTPRWISDLAGTRLTKLGVGVKGALTYLKFITGGFAVRNEADSADAALTVSALNVSGNVITINSDAASTGADWKLILQRAASGMTADVTLTFPPDDGSPGDVLITDGSGVLSFGAPTSNGVRTDTTSVAFGASSPITMFTTPASSKITAVRVYVDTAFDGATPTLSIGISGTTSKYGSTGQSDLTTIGIYEWDPGVGVVGGEALIATYAASSSTVGAARIEVDFVVPS